MSNIVFTGSICIVVLSNIVVVTIEYVTGVIRSKLVLNIKKPGC